MFEVGMQELALIFVVALVVLGPQRLPKLVAQVGRWVGKARHMARQFHDQLESEINLEELSKAKAREPAPSPVAPVAPLPVIDPVPQTPAESQETAAAPTEPAHWAQPSSLAGVAPESAPEAAQPPAEAPPASTPTYTETHERVV